MSDINIKIEEQQVSLLPDETKELKVTGIPDDVTEATWKSDNINVVTITKPSTSGATIKTIAPGTAVVSVTIIKDKKPYTAKCRVTVDAILLDKSELSVKLGESGTIAATVKGNAEVTWTSENEGIATVSVSDKNKTTRATIEPKAPGVTVVTAKIEIDQTTYTATCKVTVDNYISLDSSAFSFDIGEEQTINAAVSNDSDIKWESNNVNVATFSTDPEKSKTATIKAIAPGTAVITVKEKEYSATCIVTVNPPRLNKNKQTLLKGNKFQLEVIPSSLSVIWSTDEKDLPEADENNKVEVLSNEILGTWRSSKKSVATVDKNGEVTAYSKGEAIVTATITIGGETYSDKCVVIVEEKMQDVLVDMANERFDPYKDGEDKYIFSFTPKSKKDELILVQGEKAQCELNGNSGNKVFSFVLTEVSFHKEIYRPGCVEAVIKTNAELPLFEGWISLEYIKEGEESPYTIAQNYYIFEKKKKRGYVTLKAYSADQFLTLDKFCQVYTGKKLVDEMIATTFEKYVSTVNFNKYCTAVGDEKCVANLQHLGATAKIPYAVQYNESFYDFLVRMCNRHGEFLYCEGNQLHIGLQASTEALEEINENDDVEIEYSESGWTYANAAQTMFSDCLKADGVGGTYNSGKKTIEKPQNQMFADDSIYPEHYFEKYQKSGEKVDGEEYEYANRDEFASNLDEVFTTLKSFAESPTLADALVSTGVKKSIEAGVIARAKNMINDKYNETYFDEVKLGDGTISSYYPFASPNDGLNGDFYNTILQKEIETEKNKVTVVCSTCQKYQLGDRVTIGTEEHVVYRVKGSAKVLDGVLDGVRRYVDSYELLLLPMIGKKEDKKEDIKEDKKYYPLPMPERRILKASPQRAIVKNNMDPKKLGRVQVAYPWQSVDDTNLSPWLRVAYPMATEEGGFMFFPAIGDEVLVDYEGGNIERPFVTGSFYSEDRKPAGSAQMHLTGVTKSITSANGHHISFTDPKDNRKFVTNLNLVPIWSLFTKFGIDGTRKEWWETHGKHFVGGFEIADYFGVYSIKGNTEDRSISIESPLGDITLDAFTGITINAPHGDVKILGKNVDIEARNNLTITSGTNIKNSFIGSRRDGRKRDNLMKQVFRGVGDFLGSLIKFIGLDLSFYRICLEVVLRPIGGTMLVKSHRFMHIEAGDGEVPLQSVRKESEGIKDNLVAAWHWASRRSFGDNKTEIPLETQIRNLYEESNKTFHLFVKAEDRRSAVLTKKQKFVLLGYKEDEYWKKLVEALSNSKITSQELKKHFADTATKNTLPVNDYLEEKYINLSKELAALKGIYDTIDTLNAQNNTELTNLKAKYDKDDWKKFVEHFEQNKSYTQPFDKTSLIKTWTEFLYTGIKNLLNDCKDITFANWDKNNSASANIGGMKYKVEPISRWHMFLEGLGKAALNSTGTEGLKDENMWSIKDKGGIYFSAEKGHAFHLSTDGSLQGHGGKDLYNLVYDYLKRIIDLE